MPHRSDISNKLTHFTRGDSDEEAYARLKAIIASQQLMGSGTLIRGGFPCVCFTEAPLESLEGGLVNPQAYSRYRPFGLIFEKDWIYTQGGRPVIYQPEAEYDLLPPELRWRHVRYDPGIVDFTWEREWRVHVNALQFDARVAGIVVPSAEWADRLVIEHNEDQDFEIYSYATVIDAQIAELYRAPFAWNVFPLT